MVPVSLNPEEIIAVSFNVELTEPSDIVAGPGMAERLGVARITCTRSLTSSVSEAALLLPSPL